jgi:predicted AlkP superfamily phosphohydrolase/phosphomutase
MSSIPAVSAPAWTSFATGKNPGKHSIFGFTKRMKGSYNLAYITGKHNKAQTLWSYLSAQEKKVIVINIPMTYPPEPVNGILVSGCDAPGKEVDFTYPREFKEKLFEISPDYRISITLGGYLSSNKRRLEAIDILFSSIETRLKLVLHLMEHEHWDFFAVKFNDPDVIQHHFWKYMDPSHSFHESNADPRLKDAIYSIYRRLDQVLYDIEKHLTENDTLIIMSDHGAGPRTNKAIYLNEWLLSRGYLGRNTDAKNRSSLPDYIYNSMEKVLRFLLRSLPLSTKDSLKRLLPGAVSEALTYFKLAGIEWSKTKAYVGEIESIRINCKGSYPEGIVELNEYNKLVDSIINEILTIKDPETGEKVIENAVRREHIYKGPHLEEIPEIILMTKDWKYDVSWKFFRGRRIKKSDTSFVVKQEHWRGTSGMHRPNGILIAKGPHIKKYQHLKEISIMDIFPTVLYDMNLPIPDDLDGKVITGAFIDSYQKAHEIHFAGSTISESKEENYTDYSPDEAQRIKRFLKDLGYME